MATISGYAATFDAATEIDSRVEGNFIEKISRGAFARTIVQNRKAIRLLLEHGKDPIVGLKPLGALEALREDDRGLFYSAELFPTNYNAEIEPALRAGQMGASFRFKPIRETYDPRPGRSTSNPKGLPVRRLDEVQLYELGPCCFPAYPTATASVRSPGDVPPAGRVEVGTENRGGDMRSLTTAEPFPLQLLRKEAKTSREAVRLLREVERGRKIEIRWQQLDEPTRTRTTKARSWELGPARPRQRGYLLPSRPSWQF